MASIAQTQPRWKLSGLLKLLDKLLTLAFTAGILALLGYAWTVRDRYYITAETGLGYYLGITGGVMMLLMLLYSARKHLRFMHVLGAQRYWFRFHMTFGVLGPTLIILHTNFNMGSTNSSIALICMLLVAGSGLIGRIIYTKIHLGLYGKKITLKELQDEITKEKEVLGVSLKLPDDVTQQLQQLENQYLRQKMGVLGRLWLFISISIRIRLAYRNLMHQIKTFVQAEAARSNLPGKTRSRLSKDLAEHVWRYLATLRKIVQLSIYERLFGLWHVIHIPIFFMMLITAIVHVVAVHLY